MKFKDFTKDKLPGFWVSVGVTLLSLITAITYIACYTNTDKMNYWGFAFLLIGAIATLVLGIFKKYTYIPYVLGFCSFMGLLFYIYAMYYYVSVVMVGIDLDHFEPQFIVCTIFIAITFIAGVVDIFMNQTKQIEVKEENK